MQKWSLGSLVPRPLPDWPGDKASPLVDPLLLHKLNQLHSSFLYFPNPAEPSSLIKHYPTTFIVFFCYGCHFEYGYSTISIVCISERQLLNCKLHENECCNGYVTVSQICNYWVKKITS